MTRDSQLGRDGAMVPVRENQASIYSFEVDNCGLIAQTNN